MLPATRKTAITAQALPILVRRLVAHAPIAVAPEPIIETEECAARAVETTLDALSMPRPDERFDALRAAERAAVELRAQVADLHAAHVVDDTLFEAMGAAITRLIAALRGHQAEARQRRRA